MPINPDLLVKNQQEKAVRQQLDVLKNKANDIKKTFWDLGQQLLVDYYPKKVVPFCFSRLYVFDTTEVTQTSADLNSFRLPRNGNVFVNAEGDFFLTSINMSCAIRASSAGTGDLFDGAIIGGGGGGFRPQQDENGVVPEFDFYDKTSRRLLNEGKIPHLIFQSTDSENRKFRYDYKFDAGSEIEPRLYLAYSAANAYKYLNIMFKGYKVLGEYNE